ncbi:MAG: NACHT domain-containing protein [Chryseobacterium culicis]
MYKIDWNTFKVKNENYTKSFEDLCYHLFCRTHKFPSGIKADFNHVGLETYPKLSTVTGKRVGFQSKFFEHSNDYGQILNSIEKAIEKHGKDLDEITIFLNTDAKTSSKSPKNIEKIAADNDIKIVWFTKDRFKVALNEANNLDLAQLYFGLGDEYGFIRDNITVNDSTFLQSDHLLTLPIINLKKGGEEEIEINDKIVLLTGNPGSGKSILVKKIFFKHSRLGESKEDFSHKSFLPMLIQLKDCYADSLENIIRNRQNDYKVRNQSLSFCYIFDGLDELSENQSDNILQYIKQLSWQTNTQHIIISCRKGSLNKLKVAEYFKDHKKYEIANLQLKHIETYFEKKGDVAKNKRLKSIKNKNQKLLKEITDIFLIKLLWDIIEDVNENSTIIDILEFKIFSLLKNTDHKNNLDDLNLLNPKEHYILELNEYLSYQFSKKYQYRFSQISLSKLLETKFEKIDYKSINQILNYNANAFFDTHNDKINSTEVSYIYQHRRYQEYFFARALKKKFEKNLKIIRNNGVIINSDFFDEVFLKYLEREYKKSNDIAGLVLLKSISVYQQNGDKWYISESEHFVNNLAYQQKKNLEILFNGDVIDVEKFIPRNYNNALKFFENDLADEGQNLVDQIKKENVDLKEREAYIFYKLCIKKEQSYQEYFCSQYRQFYQGLSLVHIMVEQISPRDYAVKSIFKIGLKYFPIDLVNLIKDFTKYEVICLVDLLSDIEFLPFFFQNAELRKEIREKIKLFRDQPHLDNLSVYYFKNLLGFKISEKQNVQIQEVLAKFASNMSSYSLVRNIKPLSLIYHLIGKDNFRNTRELKNLDLRCIDKYSFLQLLYVNALKEERCFSKHLAEYHSKFGNYYPSEERFVHNFSILWSYIFFYSKGNSKDYNLIVNLLNNDFDTFVFLEYLNKQDRKYFSEVISEADLNVFEMELKSWKTDFPKFIDRCFILSGMLSRISPDKSVLYITKGFANNYLRHGWRKDVIVSHFLNDAFGKILEKKWFSSEELLSFSEKLYQLNLRLYQITDKDHTRYGVSELIDVLSKHDPRLANKYFKKFRKLDEDWYIENIALTSILINSIQLNRIDYKTIQERLEEYTVRYDYRDSLDKQYAEKIFRVHMEILKSSFYSDENTKSAFDKAVDIVGKVDGKFSYQKGIIDDYYAQYDLFCKKYDQPNLIQLEDSSYNYEEISEGEFSQMIDEVSTSAELKALYKLYQDWNNKVEIKDKNIWKKLIDKTIQLEGNIKLFCTTVKKLGYLLTGFGDTHNAEYLHIGIAQCLEHMDVRSEMEAFLTENAGYGGFYKMIYIYSELNDKKNTKKLFSTFYNFCDFLVSQ